MSIIREMSNKHVKNYDSKVFIDNVNDKNITEEKVLEFLDTILFEKHPELFVADSRHVYFKPYAIILIDKLNKDNNILIKFTDYLIKIAKNVALEADGEEVVLTDKKNINWSTYRSNRQEYLQWLHDTIMQAKPAKNKTGNASNSDYYDNCKKITNYIKALASKNLAYIFDEIKEKKIQPYTEQVKNDFYDMNKEIDALKNNDLDLLKEIVWMKKDSFELAKENIWQKNNREIYKEFYQCILLLIRQSEQEGQLPDDKPIKSHNHFLKERKEFKSNIHEHMFKIYPDIDRTMKEEIDTLHISDEMIKELIENIKQNANVVAEFGYTIEKINTLRQRAVNELKQLYKDKFIKEYKEIVKEWEYLTAQISCLFEDREEFAQTTSKIFNPNLFEINNVTQLNDQNNQIEFRF